MKAKVKIIKVGIKEVDLKKMRERKGISLRHLEDLSGVSFAHIQKVETGLLVMSEPTWEKIKNAIDNYRP